MSSRRYVGRRQTTEPTLVNLYRWLVESRRIHRVHARAIVNYVDDRFVPKGKDR